MGSSHSCAPCPPTTGCIGPYLTHTEVTKSQIMSKLEEALDIFSCGDKCDVMRKILCLSKDHRKYMNHAGPNNTSVQLDRFGMMYFQFVSIIGRYMVTLYAVRITEGMVNVAGVGIWNHEKKEFQNLDHCLVNLASNDIDDCVCSLIGAQLLANTDALSTGDFPASGKGVFYSFATRPSIHFTSDCKRNNQTDKDCIDVCVKVLRFTPGGDNSQKIIFYIVDPNCSDDEQFRAEITDSSQGHDGEYCVTINLPERNRGCGRRSFYLRAVLADKCSCDLASCSMDLYHNRNCEKPKCDTCAPHKHPRRCNDRRRYPKQCRNCGTWDDCKCRPNDDCDDDDDHDDHNREYVVEFSAPSHTLTEREISHRHSH